MTIHIFANIVTPYGTASNNRGENDGNTTTLQKLVWKSQVHTTVSAEAIRFALRRLFIENGEKTNRYWDETDQANHWNDPEFASWAGGAKSTFIDDDLLGYMRADAAKDEGKAGTATIRRAVLEISRAVSLTPWGGDVSFNAASPGATPSAAKSKKEAAPTKQNPAPYNAELHATRYQYGLAMTPERLADKSRAAKALNAVGSLRCVAGNHGRFLYDFAPEIIIIRITDDPAPRMLYCFDTPDGGKTVSADSLFQRIDSGDIAPQELYVGVSDLNSSLAQALTAKNVSVAGVRSAVASACKCIDKVAK
ncbi:MAG: type I-B CRISPR-associated protein Cas7/Cst2/DevR [Thermoguttaceae bacterium]|nr:type I-B CRISPR-associated protein Cas7/Cst2/DevR [Thermoguttaceae bacterium]